MDKVLLGLPGEWAHNSCEASGNYTSKVGGLPDWPLPDEYIRSDLLHCPVCGSKLCLVAQVFAPISVESIEIEERLLFVLGCVMPGCGSKPESWRALRLQKFAAGGESCTTSKVPFGTASIVHKTGQWEDTNEDNEDDMDLEELGRALFDAGSLASNSKKSQNCFHPETLLANTYLNPRTRVINSDMPVLPCFYTYTEQALSTNDLDSISSNYSSLSIEDKRNVSGSEPEDSSQEESWEEEKYEPDKALNADRAYLKFKKRLDASPQQCYRYSYGQKPLLATNDEVNPGTCNLCGEPRQFEMQLMPPLLYFLREAVDEDRKEALENWIWLTLIVCTCSKSCAPANGDGSNSTGWVVAEEAAVMQSEEDLPGYKELGF